MMLECLQEHNIPQLETTQLFIHEATTNFHKPCTKMLEQFNKMHYLHLFLNLLVNLKIIFARFHAQEKEQLAWEQVLNFFQMKQENQENVDSAMEMIKRTIVFFECTFLEFNHSETFCKIRKIWNPCGLCTSNLYYWHSPAKGNY